MKHTCFNFWQYNKKIKKKAVTIMSKSESAHDSAVGNIHHHTKAWAAPLARQNKTEQARKEGRKEGSVRRYTTQATSRNYVS